MATHYDALETRSAPERERALMAALMRQIAHAKAHTSAFAELLAHIEPASVSNRAALSALPVVRKHEDYMARQGSRRDGADAFGGFAAVGWNGLRATKGTRRVFQSPGPIYEPEGHGGDFERGARAMFAAGFRAGELVHNSFSYHLTPAGAMMESAASVLGCTVFPGGVGNTELQIRAIVDLAPTCYVGTPSFLRTLLERAAQLGHADRQKLGEYLDSVRAIEKRIEFDRKRKSAENMEDPLVRAEIEKLGQAIDLYDDPGRVSERHDNHTEQVRLMLDLIALAFWTDSTRVSTFVCPSDDPISQGVGTNGGYAPCSYSPSGGTWNVTVQRSVR